MYLWTYVKGARPPAGGSVLEGTDSPTESGVGRWGDADVSHQLSDTSCQPQGSLGFSSLEQTLMGFNAVLLSCIENIKHKA